MLVNKKRGSRYAVIQWCTSYTLINIKSLGYYEVSVPKIKNITFNVVFKVTKTKN